MKKRFLPLCLATSTLLTFPTTSTATFYNETSPFIELEAMKMFCTVRVDLSRSNVEIAQDIEPTLSSMGWAVRLHPDADQALQNRFEEIVQLIANTLGETVGGFEPQVIVQETAEPLGAEIPLAKPEARTFYYDLDHGTRPRPTLLKTFPIAEESQVSVKTHSMPMKQEENNSDALDALSFPSSPSGGSGIQEKGRIFGVINFGSFAFTPAFTLPKISALKQFTESRFEISRGVSPLRPRLSRLSLPPKASKEPFKEPFKMRDFLNKLQKMALANWLKAEVISPFVAGILLLITHLRGDILLPRATALLYRRRQRGLSF